MKMPAQTVTFETQEPAKKLAILIDADNAQPSSFEYILSEIAKYGETTVKRIYGDFTTNASQQWRAILNKYAIKPMQQFAYTKGKNATDSTMIIDAMDLLYTKRFDGFCIVSSDSDFTGLATRIREEGLLVFGFGRKTTPESFINACHKFTPIEILFPAEPEKINNEIKNTAENSVQIVKQEKIELPIKFIKEALEMAADENGWANIGTFGSYLTKIKPDFDSRQYGHKKLSELIRSRSDIFEIDESKAAPNGMPILYLRTKKQ